MTPPRQTRFRRSLLFLFRRIIGLYFREIEVMGDIPDENVGGRIFGGNHVNGLVDPILVLTQARIPISPIAKSTLWKIPGLRWLLDAGDAVPILRKKDDPNKQTSQNDATFEKIAQHLSGGGNILIFPEGTSHNEPHLIPLRSGAGRMLARAKADGAKGLTFQSVGLEFEARSTFRSRVLLLFGPVRSVDETGLEGDELARAITETMSRDLGDLIVEGETWDDRLLIARVAEMFAHGSGDRTLAGWNAIGRRVEAVRVALPPSDPTYAAIARAVAAYYVRLDAAGMRDRDVAPGAGIDGARFFRAIALVLVLPLALVGTVLYFLPYQLPRLVARLARGDEDVVSTYKLGAGLVVFPAWAAILVALAFVFLARPLAYEAVVLALLSPFAALAWNDRSASLRATMRGLSPFLGREQLQRARAEVMTLLDDARSRLGSSAERSN